MTERAADISAPAEPAPGRAELTTSRLHRAAGLAAEQGIDALVVTAGSDLRYLIGTTGDSHERLTALVISAAGESRLLVPKLEYPAYRDLGLAECGVEALTWTDERDPHRLLAKVVPGARRIAVSASMTAQHLLPLRAVLPDTEQVLAGSVLSALRIRKDAAEIAELRAAGAAIDRVHARMGDWLRVGRTEREVGADIAAAIVEEGHGAAEFVIVGSGPNGASPHHEQSDRVLERGDVVVIDIGGPLPSGYNSDSTRTYSLGSPAARTSASYAVLQDAQRAAVTSVRPGIAAESVDEAARGVITRAGMGENFIHRTGHGIGLDVHEEPYIVQGNATLLEEGMAFSIEPGIYRSGSWGARIEDIVVVTADGCECLNNRPHELVELPA